MDTELVYSDTVTDDMGVSLVLRVLMKYNSIF